VSDPRRALPSVNALLISPALQSLFALATRSDVTAAIRSAVDNARLEPGNAPTGDSEWAAAVQDALASRRRRSLRRVLNATGVVLHTNVGRAPLPRAAIDAIREVAEGYCNLEYDVERGERGSRYTHCVSLIRELTGAEDALVVNNGAAALVLALNTFADGAEAIVSRGELVEIGGSFRVPDIMAKSGARLVEVGTTNRTHLDDYKRALSRGTGAIVKVHRSNFTVAGFVAEVEVRDLAPLAIEAAVPLLHDLGSGLLLPLDKYGLVGETILAQSVREGATVVTASGDKLLGGPQAGLAIGSADAIARMRRNPLTRALRVDKLTLTALEATLALYRDPETALREIPALAMLTAPVDAIRARAVLLRDQLSLAGVQMEVADTSASVGGGAFPSAAIPSAALAITGDAAALEAKLRDGDPPVIGRIDSGRLLLDLRSVPETDDQALAAAVIAALQ